MHLTGLQYNPVLAGRVQRVPDVVRFIGSWAMPAVTGRRWAHLTGLQAGNRQQSHAEGRKDAKGQDYDAGEHHAHLHGFPVAAAGSTL